jgi:hypothetical protein
MFTPNLYLEALTPSPLRLCDCLETGEVIKVKGQKAES